MKTPDNKPGLQAPDRDERGMILINVLLIVMLATSVLAIMIAGADSHVERTISLRSAAQAMAIARGGELSAVAALRRDLAAGASTDDLTEEWANIADSNVRVQGGRFSFAVADAQARFNINSVARGDSASQAMLFQLTAAAGLPEGTADRISALIGLTGPVSDLDALRIVGLDAAQLAKLARFCTVLPKPTDVNLNTAPEPLIAALLSNDAAARTLISLRARSGGLNGQSIRGLGILLPPGTGLTSDYYWARARVEIGNTSQQLTSLLHRRMGTSGPSVIAVRRWRGTPPIDAPQIDQVAQ
jgi:general secretion pathway protein K